MLTQAEAVPAAYAANRPDQFSYIHFVAHGTASRLSPLDSAVVLSAAPEHPDSFKLYARDIVRHPLHARLVTISACYGSGSRTYAGEGLVGLSWAFLRAGSHNVIGALWEVNDASTPLLMDRLYSELDAGRRPDAALRTAKLSLIHSQSVYRKPLYWGRSSFTRVRRSCSHLEASLASAQCRQIIYAADTAHADRSRIPSIYRTIFSWLPCPRLLPGQFRRHRRRHRSPARRRLLHRSSPPKKALKIAAHH